MKFLFFFKLLLLFRSYNGEPNANPMPNPMANPMPNPMANPMPDPMPNPRPEPKPEPKPAPKAEPNPKADPDSHFFLSSHQSEPIDFWSQLPMNSAEPKTIVISSPNDSKNEPNLFQTLVNSISSGSNGEINTSNPDISEIIFPEHSFQDQIQLGPSGPQPIESFQNVYSLPAVTRMIASSEVDSDNKKNQIWRSPLPFIHPEDCPHHKANKKLKAMKRKGRRQRKSELKPKTTPKPEFNESPDPLSSLLPSVLTHLLSAAVPEPEAPKIEVKGPSSFLMSITRRSEPQISDIPFIPEPKPEIPIFMTLLRKRSEPLSEPEPDIFPPLNPFLSILSHLHKPSESKSIFENIEKKPKESAEEKNKHQTNFNFNINFTINNHNYPQPETRPQSFSDFPIPIIFK